MRDVVVSNVGTINMEKLDADIRAAVATFGGLSRGRDRTRLTLHFENNTTDEQIATAQGMVTSHDPNSKTPEQQARLDLKVVAQSAVGVAYADLTTAQLKALLAVLIMESGGLANDLTIKPLAAWVR